MTSVLRDGEPVILHDRRGRRYLKRLRAGHRITIRSSVLASDALIGRTEGSRVVADDDEPFRVFRPSYAEVVPLLERSAEPIFAKDAGLIVMRGDIRPGQTVVEIGVGSGVLSMALLRAVGPAGHLFSYEIRADMAEEARANVALYEGACPQWTLKVRDGRAGVDEQDVDRVVIDVLDSVAVLETATQALRDGGILIAYVCGVLQLKALHDAIEASRGLGLAESYEVLERGWHIEGPSIRPEARMVGHTGFITVARRLAR
ncbi:MAG TPA: hypothetical protein VEC57_01385 [Candidatus Limnocylindrales bacterium]|nr:hypothetical protein [Candidatus Limnocylindrales bacterium]